MHNTECRSVSVNWHIFQQVNLYLSSIELNNAKAFTVKQLSFLYHNPHKHDLMVIINMNQSSGGYSIFMLIGICFYLDLQNNHNILIDVIKRLFV